MHTISYKRLSFLSTLCLLSFAPGAQAFEAEDVVQRFQDSLLSARYTLNYESLRQEDANIILSKTSVGSPYGFTAELGDFTLEQVTEDEHGNVRVGRIAVDNVKAEAGDLTVAISGYEERGIALPRDPNTDPFAGVWRSDALKIRRFHVALKGAEAFSFDNLDNELTISEGSLGVDRYTVERYTVNLPAALSAAQQNTIPSLPIETITGQLDLTFAMDVESGEAQSKLQLVMDGLGVIKTNETLSGYTRDYLNRIRKSAAQQPKTHEASGNYPMELLELFSELQLVESSSRFEDKGLTQLLLEYAAKSQGMSPEQMRATTKQSLALLTLDLEKKLGDANAAEAIEAFLENPRSIELRSRPKKPVPLLPQGSNYQEIARAVHAMGLTIIANQE